MKIVLMLTAKKNTYYQFLKFTILLYNTYSLNISVKHTCRCEIDDRVEQLKKSMSLMKTNIRNIR